MSFSDTEYRDPKDSDTNCCNTNDAGCEEEHGDEQEDDVVDGKDLRRLDQDPVDWVEDINVTEKMTTMFLADGVFRFVNASDEHADPDQKNDNDQEEAQYELYGAEYSSKLEPDPVDEALILA